MLGNKLLSTLNAKPDLYFSTGKNLENSLQNRKKMFKYIYMSVYINLYSDKSLGELWWVPKKEVGE